MPCVQKKRVFLPGYRRSVTRNWRSAYEGSSRLRSNEVPGGDFKRRNGLASARWRDQVPTSPDKSRQVPIWEKSNLSLEEAAAYSGIGINKLREITNEDKCKFVLWVGNKRLIKRRLFDCYIEQAYSI